MYIKRFNTNYILKILHCINKYFKLTIQIARNIYISYFSYKIILFMFIYTDGSKVWNN